MEEEGDGLRDPTLHRFPFLQLPDEWVCSACTVAAKIMHRRWFRGDDGSEYLPTAGRPRYTYSTTWMSPPEGRYVMHSPEAFE